MEMRDGNSSVPLLLGFGAFVLTAISLGASLYLSVQFPHPSEHVGRLIETCSTTWKIGFGTFITVWARTYLSASRTKPTGS
jgi:hypothetical protein